MKRYDICRVSGTMEKFDDGEYVKYDDCLAELVEYKRDVLMFSTWMTQQALSIERIVSPHDAFVGLEFGISMGYPTAYGRIQLHTPRRCVDILCMTIDAFTEKPDHRDLNQYALRIVKSYVDHVIETQFPFQELALTVLSEWAQNRIMNSF